MITLLTKPRVRQNGLGRTNTYFAVLELNKRVVKALAEARAYSTEGASLVHQRPVLRALTTALQPAKGITWPATENQSFEDWTVIDKSYVKVDVGLMERGHYVCSSEGINWELSSDIPSWYPLLVPQLSWKDFDWLKTGCVPFNMPCVPKIYRTVVNTRLTRRKIEYCNIR